jgi:NADPH:quinone reductase
MRAIRCHAFGPPESLVLEELADLTPGDLEVVIDVKAAGVNFPDVLIVQGLYQFKPELPFTPGSELSGVVRAVGAGVTRFKPGDAVVAFVGNGAFASQACADQNMVVPMPSGMDFEVAAAFTLAYGTSHHAVIDRGQLKAGETLLVLGAAGGVGLAALEIGKAVGARVIAAASTDEKLEVCKAHGADDTINYATRDLREALKTLGVSPDVIFDPVGGAFTEAAFRSIAWRGRYLVVGFANGEIPKLPLNLALLKGASINGVFWGEFVKREPKSNLANIAQMLEWVREGKLRPLVSGRYALADTARALQDMASRKVTGKIVIVP